MNKEERKVRTKRWNFIEGSLLPPAKVEPVLQEANEIVTIMAASRISAAGVKQSAIANRKLEIS